MRLLKELFSRTLKRVKNENESSEGTIESWDWERDFRFLVSIYVRQLRKLAFHCFWLIVKKKVLMATGVISIQGFKPILKSIRFLRNSRVWGWESRMRILQTKLRVEMKNEMRVFLESPNVEIKLRVSQKSVEDLAPELWKCKAPHKVQVDNLPIYHA